MILTYIEDIIEYICNSAQSEKLRSYDVRDRTILTSINAQLSRGLPLTLGQLNLVLKIISSRIEIYKEITNIFDLLDDPNTKLPIREVSKLKTMCIRNGKICISFPFNPKIISIIAKYKKNYIQETKTYELPYSEKTCYELYNGLKPFDFTYEPPMDQIIDSIKAVIASPDDYLPTVNVNNNNELVFSNVTANAVNYFESVKKDSLLHNLYLAIRVLNLRPTKKAIELINKQTTVPKFLLSETNTFLLSPRFECDRKAEILKITKQLNVFPILIQMNDDNFLVDEFTRWIKAFSETDIPHHQVSVLFRTSRQGTAKFNSLVSEHKLNNYVTNDTKIVIIADKEPKILYKLNFYPLMRISYQLINKVEAPTVIYYNNNELYGFNTAIYNAEKL